MILSIVIPVYNEEKTIAELLKKVIDVKLDSKISKEIIIVNDGSTDRTLKALNSEIGKLPKVLKKNLVVITHPINKGKGAAIRTGFSAGNGDIYIIQDADLEYDPAFFHDLIKPVYNGKEKVVYGTRLKYYPLKLWGKDKTPLPTHWIGNHFLTFFTNFLYGSSLTDMETCYKVLSKEVKDNLVLDSKGFEIEPEITSKILKKGYRILEVPITTKPRTHKEGKKISWRDGFVAVWTLIKYRFVD